MMKENISKVLKVDPDQVNVKATTEEHLGFTGEGLGISAQAVCFLSSLEYNLITLVSVRSLLHQHLDRKSVV